jgi:hypothetical protein
MGPMKNLVRVLGALTVAAAVTVEAVEIREKAFAIDLPSEWQASAVPNGGLWQYGTKDGTRQLSISVIGYAKSRAP